MKTLNLSLKEIFRYIFVSYIAVIKKFPIFLGIYVFCSSIFVCFIISVTLIAEYLYAAESGGTAESITTFFVTIFSGFSLPFFIALNILILSPSQLEHKKNKIYNFIRRVLSLPYRNLAIIGSFYVMLSLPFLITLKFAAEDAFIVNQSPQLSGEATNKQNSNSYSLPFSNTFFYVEQSSDGSVTQNQYQVSADTILAQSLVSIAQLLLVIAVLILTIWTFFAIKLLVERKLPLLFALKKSLRVILQNSLGVFLVYICNLIINILFLISVMSFLGSGKNLYFLFFWVIFLSLVSISQNYALWYLVADKMLEVDEAG